MKNDSHTAGSSNSLDSQSRKCSFPSDQIDSNTKRVRFDKNSIFLSEINISSEPTYNYSQLESNFDALNKGFGKIEVNSPFVKQSRVNLVRNYLLVLFKQADSDLKQCFTA